MIQIITGNNQVINSFKNDNKYTISDFRNPKAFDDFKLNVLDLGFDELWRNKGNSYGTITMLKDLKHYTNIISNSDKAKILVIMPQNINYKYCFTGGKYIYQENLKNMLDLIEELFLKYIYSYAIQIYFETTSTTFGNSKIKADFHFDINCFDDEEIISVSDNSKKLTTIKVKENLYYTTLDLMCNKEAMERFIKKLKIDEDEVEKMPEWAKTINILDDVLLKEKVNDINNKIKNLEDEKNIQMQKLNKNNKIKSILYQTDKSLQNTVITILNEMVDYEDNDFVDKMEEDYKIKKDEVTFIIETKGLSRNIKGEDISKTSNHVEIYLDELDERNITENVKGIYIAATQRNKKVEEREETPDRQIKLAKRNNILIIRTEELLKVFEDFRNKKIGTKEIIKLFSEQSGELKYNKE